MTNSPVRCTRLRLIAIAFVMLQVAGYAQDGWPFVRGPHFDGHSAEVDLADSWPRDGPPVLWTRDLGQGYSAFIAHGDRVYTQAQGVTGQYVYCLDANNGATDWEHRYDWPYEAAGVYPGPRSTPTYYKDRIYFTSPDGLLGCLNEQDGKLLWSIALGDVYGIKGSGFGYSCSPTLIDDMVILPVGGNGASIVAFDFKTGHELWKSASDPASYTPAFPVELNGKPLVVCYMQNSLLVLDRKTGAVQRRISLSKGYDEHSAWPIYSEPYLWLSAPFKAGSWVVDLSKQEANAVWRSDLLSNDVCSSVCIDGNIYGFDILDVQSKTHRPSKGIFRCIELQTGQSLWSNGSGRPRRSSNKDEFRTDIGQSGIIAADGKLVILNELGELILLKQDATGCNELARCDVLSGELTWTAPCLHRQRLYIRNQSLAVCIYLGKAENLTVVVKQRASDVAGNNYFNLSHMLLPVEPEFAFDVPEDRWLLQWAVAGLAILLFARVAGAAVCRLLRAKSPLFGTMAIAVVLGAIGTTCLGMLVGEFVFTWPVSLYAAFEYVVAAGAKPPHEKKTALGFLKRRIPAITFLVLAVVYFLLCRRLSLIFEWAFLAGFPGAIPVLWYSYRGKEQRAKSLAARTTVSLAGFSCFFAVTVLLLKTRY